LGVVARRTSSLFYAFFLRQQVYSLEIIGNGQLVGPVVLLGSPFSVDRRHVGVVHGGMGIEVGLFHALAMRHLCRARHDPGHIGVFRDDNSPVRVGAEHQVAYPAAEADKRGIKGYFCHVVCTQQGYSRVAPRRSRDPLFTFEDGLPLVSAQAQTKRRAKTVCVEAYAPTHTVFATSLL